jgi:endonuclease/exonuclease/phosphatase family metal-dependent hydrolase
VLELGNHAVRSADTLAISDHLPVVAGLSLP